MNELDKLFSETEEPSDSEARLIVDRYLKDVYASLLNGDKDPIVCAYDIAGIMGSDFFQRLPIDDPMYDVFIIAGELEVNPDNAAELTQELITKIAHL